MERFTISLNDDLASAFDALIRTRGYMNRSEAVRDLLRREIAQHRLEKNSAPYCVAALSYLFNHLERHLSERLADRQHHRHALVISTMHVHLDQQNCLETMLLQGPTAEVHDFAEAISAETGVRHSALNLITIDPSDAFDAGHTPRAST